ncbi:isochorismatase family protein [Nonomuraea sp. NPDC023979]|uniref:isochorismatase family protein n=1 Tax=Nonomuraea sp. NPDC023979 TaxID=3154796 RepID=UPI0033CCAE02
MPIAAIAPYAMPATMPDSRVNWAPDPRRAVLLIHDMQHYFLRPYQPDAEPHADLMANLLAIRQRCTELSIPIIYTAQPGSQLPAERGLLTQLWGPGLTDVETDTAIPAPLAPAGGDIVVAKHRYSAFIRSPLATMLATAGRDQLLIGGVYAHIGIQATAVDAFSHDIQPIVLGDAVAAFSADSHQASLEYMAAHCARVLTTSDAVRALRRRPASTTPAGSPPAKPPTAAAGSAPPAAALAAVFSAAAFAGERR